MDESMVCVGTGLSLHWGRVRKGRSMLMDRVGVYALVGPLQWMEYPTLGPALVSTVFTQSFLISKSTLPL